MSRFVSGALLIALVALATTAHAGIIINEPGYTDVAVAPLPGIYGNSFGSVATDASGVVYATGAFSGNGLHRLEGGVATAIADFPATALSLAIVGNTAYVGLEGGDVWSVDLATLTSSLVGPSGHFTALDMVVAPAGFGAFGGQLIISGIQGVVAFDPTTGTSSVILDSLNFVSSLAFTNDGQLLAGANIDNQIFSVSATGVASLWASVTTPGGIAVHPVTGDVYVASEDNNTIEHFLADGTYVGEFASNVQWDRGYYPSMFSFSSDGSALIYGQVNINDPDYGVREITGFPTTAVPEPSTLISAGIAGIGLFALARRRAIVAR